MTDPMNEQRAVGSAKERHRYGIDVFCPRSEVDEEFLQRMANRMAVSYHKYGPVAAGYPQAVSAINSLLQRLESYAETGNTEYLVDAANFAMIEYMRPSIDGAQFDPTDSDRSPGRVESSGVISARPNAAILGDVNAR